ncbi:hypothetical protein FGG78_33275, partial [Thioclava sp. BHET1]
MADTRTLLGTKTKTPVGSYISSYEKARKMKNIVFVTALALGGLSAGIAHADDKNIHRVGWIGADKYPATFTSNMTARG